MKRSAIGFLVLSCALSTGFGLDRGELACEQAARALADCCPGLDVDELDCDQRGGCDRADEATSVAIGESACIRGWTCEELAAREVCGRLEARLEALRTGEPEERPTIQELYAEDWLCD